eukprot:6660876-Prymnesium_polylepis.1
MDLHVNFMCVCRLYKQRGSVDAPTPDKARTSRFMVNSPAVSRLCEWYVVAYFCGNLFLLPDTQEGAVSHQDRPA